MMNTTKKGRPPLFLLVLAVLVAVGVGVAIVRMINGLGTTTSLSDGYPWGLWIVYDVFFVPFSAGAFMILAVVHIYNRREYHALARPVVLAGFLGEVMVIAVLVMDLGRWHQFYNVLIPWYWNIRSFMLQVSICLTIYMAVMALEMAPAVLERLNWQKTLRLLRTVAVLVAGAGIVLSSLHQSSLGSLFLLMPYKLHALWWTPLLPLLFFTSAVFAGLSMAIFVAAICQRVFDCSLDLSLLAKLARVVPFILGFYLVLKFADLLVAGELGMLFSQGGYGLLFMAEILIGVVLPMVLFAIKRVRENSSGLIVGSGCVLLGLALNRTTVALVAQTAPAGASYFPNWMELVISAAAVAAGILLFVIGVRLLPILPERRREGPGVLTTSWSRWGIVLTGAGLVLVTILVVLLLQPAVHVEASKVPPDSMAQTEQVHATLPREETCQDCHREAKRLVEAGAESDQVVRLVIDTKPLENPHGRLACTTCHYGGGRVTDVAAAHEGLVVDPTAGNAQVCVACHRDPPDEFPQDRLRTPHSVAVHGQMQGVACSDCHGGVGHGFDPMSGQVVCAMSACLDCHQGGNLDSELSDCDTCHLGPHDSAATMDCSACHQSTDSWQPLEKEDHPLALTGAHAQVACFACHETDLPSEESAACVGCHVAPDESHYGAMCEDCHTTAGFSEARLPAEMHPTPLVGKHAQAPCAGCHSSGQDPSADACNDCHQRPEGHLSGECSICHTPEGWADTISFVVDLSPKIAHGQAGYEGCLMCHSLDGENCPAPSNHGDYEDSQCVLCHKSEP